MKTLILISLILLSSELILAQTGSKRDYVGSNRGSSLVDTIKTGDSLKYISIHNTSTDNYLHIKNVSGSTADTFIVANKVYGKNATFLDSVTITATNMQDNAVVTELIVPNGQSRAFLLNDKLVGILAIRRKSNSGANYQSTNADAFFLRGGTLGR